MVLRIKNFNILGFYWKIRLLIGDGVHEKPIQRGEIAYKGGGGLFADLRRGLACMDCILIKKIHKNL